MKSVCVDARMLGPCGIGAYIDNIIPFLKGSPFHFQMLVKPEDQNRFKELGWLETIPLNAPIYSITEQLKLAVAIPPCDLFWSPHYNIPILPIPAAKRLVTIHDAYHLAYYKTLNPLQKIYVKVMVRAAVQLSDRVLTVSHFSKTELMRFFPICEEKLQVISNGINSASFQDQGQDDEILLKSYQLPSRFLLFVGHLRPHKNLQGLLRAFDRICQEGSGDLFLVVIGKRDQNKKCDMLGPLLAQYSHLISKIKVIGNVPQEHLAAFYRRAQAFVFPSFYEGFGLPPLEAMSSGCPVIVSRCASLPEVCGDAAVYIDPHSPADMAQAIIRVLKDDVLRRELKVKGLQRSQNFNWKKCAEQHLETMEMLLNE